MQLPSNIQHHCRIRTGRPRERCIRRVGVTTHRATKAISLEGAARLDMGSTKPPVYSEKEDAPDYLCRRSRSYGYVCGLRGLGQMPAGAVEPAVASGSAPQDVKWLNYSREREPL